jgi:hypothetical protein
MRKVIRLGQFTLRLNKMSAEEELCSERSSLAHNGDIGFFFDLFRPN